MPVREALYEFPALNREGFRGLPGMLADALPDRFGNHLIDAWLAGSGQSPEDFNPVDRLCYIGRRGIGALEFEPALRKSTRAKKLEVARLVRLWNRDPGTAEQYGGQAASSRPISFQMRVSAAVRRSMSSSLWSGVGVKRRRSVPRATVG